MYISADKEDSLVQGDVCLDIPLPIISSNIRFFDIKAEKLIGENAPTEQMLSTRSNIAALVAMVRSPVLVLSQSCDLVDAETKPNARILVAPTLPDDDERFTEMYAAATKTSTEALAKKVATAFKQNNSVDSVVAGGKESLGRVRYSALEQLWLGKTIGVFPLAANHDIKLRRSICFFDNAVTLPASWLPLLKKQRVLRLDPNWADVLREQLSSWISRFAFPGDKNARLTVGGLGDDLSAESDNVSAPVTHGRPA